MNIINLTPHKVDICDENGNIVKTYPRSGKIARVAHGWTNINDVDGIPLVVRENEKITGLPEPQEDTMYIVSNIVFNFCSDRTDLIAPVKQVTINGRVVGCRAFIGHK